MSWMISPVSRATEEALMLKLTPNGWSASKKADEIGVQKFPLPGTNESVRLRQEVAPLLLYWAMRFGAEVEPLRVKGEKVDDWGYKYRTNKNNPDVLSEHSAGTALDLNARKHPNGKKGTFKKAQFAAIHLILADINAKHHVLQYGGDFKHTKDEMHVDVLGSLVQVNEVIARLGIQPDGSVLPTDRPSRGVDMVLAHHNPDGTFYICGVEGKRVISKETHDALKAVGVPDLGDQVGAVLNDFPTLP